MNKKILFSIKYTTHNQALHSDRLKRHGFCIRKTRATLTCWRAWRKVPYMKSLFADILVMLITSASFAVEALECHIGPMQVSLGNTAWQLTSCNDGRSLVFATMQGNPAMPFVFFVQRNALPSKINGEGNGSKKYSAAAFEELKAMTETRFDELVQATKLSHSKQ